MSGGGGFGDPLERDPERVLQDVIEEKVTPAHARSAYGVVIASGPEGPRVDEAMTRACRTAMRAAAAE
jgi:N-methylhydantoinase B